MKKHYRQENNCLNCGTILEGKYCHNCGQENLELKESFGHMMNHAISDYFHFDHQFFHTLKPLLFKPGFLTNEYMSGRRAQYLHPVKMYIFISIVYFLLLFQSGREQVKAGTAQDNPAGKKEKVDSINRAIAKNPNLSAIQKKKLQAKTTEYAGGLVTVTDGDEDDGHKSVFSLKDTSYAQYEASQQKLPKKEQDGLIVRQIHKLVIIYHKKYGERAKEVFVDELKHNIPKMMFLMLPLFALILKVTFYRNRKFYVEHLIYAFHLHCFLFIFLAFIMLVELLIPSSWAVSDWINLPVVLYIIWYIYKSLRVVYQRSKFRTVTKFIGMYVMYSLVFVFCFSVVVLFTALALA